MPDATCHGFMSFEEYRQLDAVNFSSLKNIAVSPYTYLYWLEHPRPDCDTFRFGRAFHTRALEPTRFQQQYKVWEGRRAGKEWKAFEAQASNTNQTVLTVAQAESVDALATAVRGKPDNLQMLTGGQTEVTLTWTEQTTGILCCCRIDHVPDGWTHVDDLKTAQSIDAFRFGRNAGEYLYTAQMGSYCDAIETLTGTFPESRLLAVEKAPPYESAIFEIPPELLEEGREIWRGWLQTLKRCQETNQWPQRYELPQRLQLAPWQTDVDKDDENWTDMVKEGMVA